MPCPPREPMRPSVYRTEEIGYPSNAIVRLGARYVRRHQSTDRRVHVTGDKLLYLVEKYQVVIMVGETGSGKTTRMYRCLI